MLLTIFLFPVANNAIPKNTSTYLDVYKNVYFDEKRNTLCEKIHYSTIYFALSYSALAAKPIVVTFSEYASFWH